ncbi:Hsp20/alpha crystallin family protein [Pseudoroseomonas cervicalis]|uniref:Hsp20/alpha crystallin family protein n=1 Tax=Pseudoroseomonas cervicalis ATCC 49957 TaxID=525371 RepID=D5RQ86_9PROT|nr:Hsp20/alpha crystallin family protein [Pseudoroseomonas cervicalis]EFH10544.1 Hsp20/alpha crystallin family protein [Pseudoroseomonas cervicalis ATCC 49957]
MTMELASTPAAAPEAARNTPVWRPLADIQQTREGIVLMLEMPGVAPEDVDITLERRVLTIRGRGRQPEPEALRAVHREYEPGDYERAFTLSEDFDESRIEATVKDGVLTLRLPRAAEARPRTIRVSAA